MDFSQVLLAALSADNNARAQAEEWLRRLEVADPPAYFLNLAAQIKKVDLLPIARQLAGLMIKNALDAENEILRDQRQKRWHDLPPAARSQVKQDLVQGLTSDADITRTAAAQAIAKVGHLELTTGQWPELIPGLINMAGSNQLGAGPRSAAIISLGYLCDEITDTNLVSQAEVNQILTAIVAGMQLDPSIEVKRAATQALLNTLDFADNSFKDSNQAERDQLMAAIFSASASADGVVKKAAFDCMSRVAELHYESLKPYMSQLATLTFQGAMSGEEAIAVRSVEFWTIIAETEAEGTAGPKYVDIALKDLTRMLLELMTKQNEDDDDETYTTAQAAANCLSSTAQATQNNILPHVAPFIQTWFQDPDWHKRDAAVLALGVITEGPSEEELTPVLNSAMPLLLTKLVGPGRDVNPCVRDSTAWTVGKIIDVHFSLLEIEKYFKPIIETLNAALDDEPRVAVNAAYAIHNLADNLYEIDEAGHTQLSPYFSGLIGHLLQRSDRDDWDERGLRTSCYEAINNMIEHSGRADQPTIVLLLQEAVQRLNASFQYTSKDAVATQEGLQIHLAALIQVIAEQLNEKILDYAEQTLATLLNVFNFKYAAAHEEAFRAIGAIASGCGEAFSIYMTVVFPRIMQGLQDYQDYSVCAAAMMTVGDLCRALNDKLTPLMPQIVEKLLAALKAPELHRSVKPPALAAFGDVALAVGLAFERHLLEVAELLDQVAATQIDSDDEDWVEYILRLRKAVLEAWTGIFQSYNSDEAIKAAQRLSPLAQKIVNTYLQLWVKQLSEQQDEEIDLEYLKGIVGLMGDIAAVLGKAGITSFMSRSMDWVKKALQLCDRLERLNDSDVEGEKKELTAAYTKKQLPM